MNYYFDLHIHTNISDGIVSPEVIDCLFKKRAGYFTVTDHNSVKYYYGYSSACFTGIELSVNFNFKGHNIPVHLLIYNFPIVIGDFIVSLKNKNIFEISRDLIALKKFNIKIFLAHPFYYANQGFLVGDFIKNYKYLFDGIEVLHPSVNLHLANRMLRFCRKNDLLASGGSDSHGIFLYNTPLIHLVKNFYDRFSWIYYLTYRSERKKS